MPPRLCVSLTSLPTCKLCHKMLMSCKARTPKATTFLRRMNFGTVTIGPMLKPCGLASANRPLMLTPPSAFGPHINPTMTEQEFKDNLLKFKEEPASLLHFAPCIERLIDDEYCLNLSNSLCLEESCWERHKAVAGLGPSLPNEPGLYMFVWNPKFSVRFTSEQSASFRWVLYVGKAGEEGGSGSIKNRYLTEYSKYVGKDASQLWETKEATKREEKLARYLTLRPLEFWYLTMGNVQEIARLEHRLIKLLRPPLNIQHGAKLRLGKPQPLD